MTRRVAICNDSRRSVVIVLPCPELGTEQHLQILGLESKRCREMNETHTRL